MKQLLSALALSVAAAGAFAAGPTAAPSADKPATAAKTPQQQKMATCSKEAAGKKGDERKAFMKACLSKKA